jgi:Brp/Blh family beta-carotene 15,15'-monooxygenase
LTWVLAVVAAGIGLSVSISASLLLALGVVAGLPHGAADLEEGRRAFASFGNAWWRPFLLGYCSLIAGVLVLWWLCPVVMLAAFLALSVIHFGIQDEQARGQSWASILAYGGLPVVVPAAFHRSDVERLFAILAGDHGAAITAVLAGPVAIAWLIAAAYTLGDASARPQGHWTGVAELLLFAWASPLVAFACYFALLHTPRALVAQWDHPAGPPPLARMVALTAAACVLGAGIFVMAPGLTLDANVVRTAFMLLAALTVPHMALDYVQRRSRSVEGAI